MPTFNKTGRKDKFSRINWLRDEIMKNKKIKEEVEKSSTIPPTTTLPTELITPEKTTRAADLMTTKKRTTTNPSVPLDPITSEHEATTKKNKNLSAPLPDDDIITADNMRWVLIGALLGVGLAFISLHVFKFIKNRSESSYQNL